MSDPVSSMDVEDVLSSIRRLVSEEAKGAGSSGESPSETASADRPEAAESGITGALSEIVQVMEEGGSDRPTGIPPSNDSELDGSETENHSSDSGDTEVQDGQLSFRHKVAGSPRQQSDQKLVLTSAFRVLETETSDEITPDESNNPAEEPSRAHRYLRPVENLTNEEPEDENSARVEISTATESASNVNRNPFNVSPDDTLFDRAKLAMEAVKESGQERWRPTDNVAESNSDKSGDQPIEILDVPEIIRAAISAETTDETEPQPGFAPEDEQETVPSSSPFSSTGGAFDQADAENTDKADLDEEEPSTINFAEEDPSVLDEDTLRDLVSDMVREELQGELGDRITRNVRKLVRREIQRALASREFE